jgi:hypoxanthine phosphoribosyltransferase
MGYDRIIVSAEEIQNTVLEMSEDINRAYSGIEKLVVVVVLEGARPFADDLVKRLDMAVEVVYIKASSYNGGTSSLGKVKIQKETDLKQKLAGRDVLIVDDIYDTGLTLGKVAKSLAAHGPKSMRICVLLEKTVKHLVEVPINFVGLKIDDLFVIGYGLDYNEKYRELPFISMFYETQV